MKNKEKEFMDTDNFVVIVGIAGVGRSGRGYGGINENEIK